MTAPVEWALHSELPINTFPESVVASTDFFTRPSMPTRESREMVVGLLSGVIFPYIQTVNAAAQIATTTPAMTPSPN